MAGLGRGANGNGALDETTVVNVLAALKRFGALASLMGVKAVRTVATAAVRDASNGPAFLSRVAELGLAVTLLSGEEEAEAAGYGVIAGFEDADGIIGDLGGGSLELARIKGGRVLQRASFPLGILRLAAIRANGPKALERHVRSLLAKNGWKAACHGLPLYLVGGSWRSLAKIHMQLTHYPLSILHHYTMPPLAARRLVRAVARTERAKGALTFAVSAARRPAMADAAALLSVVVNQIKPDRLVVSATGLREGLLYRELSSGQQSGDPLIIAARAEGQRQGRFAEHGDILNHWLEPIFRDEKAADQRLRHAACLLGDIGWAANPDFRCDRALEFALHSNWYGLDAIGRAMIAQALFTAFGGGAARPAILTQLAPVEDLERARRWGVAIRLGQRLSGGVAAPLESSQLSAEGGKLTLFLRGEMSALAGDIVARRLKQLATAMGVPSKIRIA